jgi:hypothetical protein
MSSREPPDGELSTDHLHWADDPVEEAPAQQVPGAIGTPPSGELPPNDLSHPANAVPSADVPPPVLFDQHARPPGQPFSRRWLAVGALAAASIVGGAAAVVASQQSDNGAARSIEPTAATLAATTTAAATTSTAPATTTTTSTTAPPTTAPPTTAAPTTPAVPVNPFGVPIGQPVDRGSPVVEERYSALYGMNADNAAPNSPAAVFATWLAVTGARAAGGVSTANGYTLTAADGSVVELRNFEQAAGKVANVTVCASPSADAAPLCRTIGDAVTLAEGSIATPMTSAITATRWATFAVGPSRRATMYNVQLSRQVSSVQGAAGEQVNLDNGVMIVTVAPDIAAVSLLVTYADGTQELGSLSLAG